MSSRNKRLKRELKKQAKNYKRAVEPGKAVSLKAAAAEVNPSPDQLPDPNLIGAGPYTQQVLERLVQVEQIVGTRPYEVFFHWLALVSNCLVAMPDHLKALAQQGFRTDQPTQIVQALYHQIDQRFPRSGYASHAAQIWDHYIEAMRVLLASLQHDMWDYQDANKGFMGPDVVADIYLAYTRRQPLWEPYPLMSWAALLREARQRFPNGQQEIVTRLKEACQRSEIGRAVLRRAPSASNPQEVYDWLTHQLIPAAVNSGFFEPWVLIDSWAGTGARLLAMATQFPHWAIHRGLVKFSATEPDPLCRLMVEINKNLWGLNGYYYALLQASVPPGATAVPPDTFSVLDFFWLAWDNYRPDRQGGSPVQTTPAVSPPTLAELYPNRLDQEYLEFSPAFMSFWK